MAFRSRLRHGDPLRLRPSGGLPPSPANSSHPLGASSSSANFPPPAGKRGPGSQPHTLSPMLLLDQCFGLSHCLGSAAARATPRMLSTSLTLVFCLPCSQTTTTSCHRRSVYRPFLTRLAIPELPNRLVDSSAQSGSLPFFFFFSPLSICSFHRLRLLLFKAGFVDFAEYLSISISVTHGVLPLCSSVSVDLSVMGSITR